MVASTLRAICQSSNRFGYSAGSARDSAALEFTLKGTKKGDEPALANSLNDSTRVSGVEKHQCFV